MYTFCEAGAVFHYKISDVLHFLVVIPCTALLPMSDGDYKKRRLQASHRNLPFVSFYSSFMNTKQGTTQHNEETGNLESKGERRDSTIFIPRQQDTTNYVVTPFVSMMSVPTIPVGSIGGTSSDLPGDEKRTRTQQDMPDIVPMHPLQNTANNLPHYTNDSKELYDKQKIRL